VDPSDGPQRHRLSGEEFGSLGSGYGVGSALATLRSAQVSKRLLLLHAVHRQIAGTDAHADDTWGALEDIAGRFPDVAREVLSHPFVDTWASRLLRSGTDLSYLAGLAIATAIRARADLSLTIPGTGQDVSIPTVGLAYGLGAGPVTVTSRDGALTLTGPAATVTVPAVGAADPPGWCGVRSLTVESDCGALKVAVDDLDPHRACFGLPVASRLTPAGMARLERLFDGAWQLITTDYPAHAVALRECLRSLVPLEAPETGSVSASAQTAFGAVAVSAPPDPAGLALLLIHEIQHVKLGGLLDLVDLLEETGDGLYHAPWRADPRPAPALLQGVYAHTGVTDFWRVRRMRTSGDEARTADFEFAYWLAQSRSAATALADSGDLTALGERFVGELRHTLDGWAGVPVASSVAAIVDDLMTAVAVRWRLDNHQPTPETAAAAAAAWREGRSCPPIAKPSVARASAMGPARADGLGAQLRARLAAVAAPPAAPAEAAYLDGRLGDAVDAYRAATIDAPDDATAWVGLAVALRRGGDAAAARALVERPDLVRASLHLLRKNGDSPSPDNLARWLAAGLA